MTTAHADFVNPNACTYEDEATGSEVRRIAMHGTRCIQPYFTNHAFLDHGTTFLYLCEDDQRHVEAYRVGIDGGDATRLTFVSDKSDTSSPWDDLRHPFWGVNWSTCTPAPRTNKLFFCAGWYLYSICLDTLKEEILYEVPRDRIPTTPHLSTDESLLVLPTTDRRINDVPTGPDHQRDTHDFIQKEKLTSDLTVIRTDGGGHKRVLEENSWISHVQFHPHDVNRLLYCHEGIWQQVEQRMWIMNISSGKSERLLDQRGTALQIGHEMWLEDGKRVLYHGWDGLKDDPSAGVSLAGTIEVDTGRRVEWRFPGATVYGHVNTWGDARTLLTDGIWDNQLLVLIDVLEDGTWKKRTLCRNGSSWASQAMHPHPRISPDRNWAGFTSDRDGQGGVFLTRLEDETS